MDAGEMAAVARLVDGALGRGWSVSVFDGGEWVVKRSADRAVILAGMFSTGEDLVRFRSGDDVVGSVSFVYGNGAEDVASDWSDNELINGLLDSPGVRLEV